MNCRREVTTIGEHVDLATGEAFQSVRFGMTAESGTLLARGDNVKEGEFEWGEKARFWPEMTPDLEKYLLREGDVLLGMDGSKVGKNWVRVQKNDLPCLLVQRVARLRAKATMDQSLLRYYIGNPQFRDYINRVKTGTSIPHISGGQIKSYEIMLPSLREQKAIAHILGTLDDKIELNRRMNATLEAMSRAIFQSWFVDFDPVKRNAEGASPRPEDLHFPDSLVESDGVSFPKGWSKGTIKDCCSQIQNGGTPRRNESRFWDGGDVPWLASGEVRQAVVTETESFITEAGLSESSAKWVPAFSTVVALYGATAGQVSLISTRLTTNQAVCALIPKTNWTYFNYFTMRAATAELISKAVGSAQQNISKGIVEETKVILPPAVLIEKFSGIVGPLFERWILNLQQSRNLAKLRDTLLPKLLSGEIAVEADYLSQISQK